MTVPEPSTFPFRLVCDRCGFLLGVAKSPKDSGDLIDACVTHVIPCAGAVNRVRREPIV